MSFTPWAACKGTVSQAAVRKHLSGTEEQPLPQFIYPETVNLPFNFSSLKDDFQLSAPDSTIPPEEGFWAIIQGGNAVLEEGPDGLQFPHGRMPTGMVPKQPPVQLGRWHGDPVYAVLIGGGDTIAPPYVVEAFNANNDRMDIKLLSLAGLAKQVLHWESQSLHCSRCGSATERQPGSWGKRCTSCGVEHFPHIHPCAIILVKRGNDLLLTRKKEWTPGRYSLVAGFLDFGESLEECAAREVREETGIDIRNIRYVGSQNWPFPAQVMAGFVAEYAGGEIQVDYHELEDARWFPVDALPDLPASRSIARWIIDSFK